MFKKILIANRGEIACRIIKTAKKLGIVSVVVYSEADTHSQAVQLADEAYFIGESASADSYLNGDKILAIAKKAGVQAIHPGYGFLSENADFARKCEKAHIVFIGPPASAIDSMGSKSAAKALMVASNVPVTPGYHGENQEIDHLLTEACQIGFPVLIKAAAGGGGKGMRAVFKASEFLEALAGAKRESKASFNDDKMLIEKYLLEPRHIEIQIFCDTHGNAVYLFERDCSIQRRHQKVIEEAPASNFKPELRKAMGEAAVLAAHSIGYVGAGTIEFLLDHNEQFYFMEMNTRLQVEHPVTEMITRQDLVEWQLRVAYGEKLPLKQADLQIHGHAIEARIYAEDPDNNFLPSTGKLVYFQPPLENNYVRVDTGFVQNNTITPYYDPMMAKLIVWGEDRKSAIQHLQHALENYYVIGVKNNIAFLKKIIQEADFKAGKLSTSFIEKHPNLLNNINPIHDSKFKAHEDSLHAYFVLACLYQVTEPSHSSNFDSSHPFNHSADPWDQKDAWQMNLPSRQKISFMMNNELKSACLEQFENEIHISYHQEPHKKTDVISHYHREPTKIRAKINEAYYHAQIFKQANALYLLTQEGIFGFSEYHPEDLYDKDEQSGGQLTAPMPGLVVALHVEVGQMVKAGQHLVVMEAMKMEHTLSAPHAGKVTEIYFPVGAQVGDGEELMAIEEIE